MNPIRKPRRDPEDRRLWVNDTAVDSIQDALPYGSGQFLIAHECLGLHSPVHTVLESREEVLALLLGPSVLAGDRVKIYWIPDSPCAAISIPDEDGLAPMSFDDVESDEEQLS
jgi:hypothetical protein